jgi:eukaryotic-like serine/threonine-protein kinase
MGYNRAIVRGGSQGWVLRVSDAFDSIVGKACIERGWVTREQLVECLRECASDVGEPDPSPSSSSTQTRLTNILVQRGLVKQDQMNALQEEITKILESNQEYEVVRRNDTSIGSLLVKGGHCSKEQLIEAISMQQYAVSKGELAPRLGEILLQKGFITFNALEQVLGLQKTKIPLLCTLCGASYSVLDYSADKKYVCKKCTGPLLPPALASADIPLEVQQAKTNPKNVLGKYVVVKELGRGGMGAVYKAWDGQLKRWCAVKLLVGTGAKDELARFRREAQTAAALRHPGIVGIYEVVEAGEKHFIAMEYVDGTSLAGEKFPALKAADLLSEVARAVEFAHSKGVIHRDLKPHNVMIDREGRPFVMDFGLAKSIDGPSHLTVQGTVVGTPSYMAPEQAEGKSSQVDRRSDVYSLGAVLYEMLTGRPPFKGPNPIETLRMVVNEDPVPPSRHNPAVLKDLETIVLKCLDKDRDKRYPSAKALAEDLERFVRGGQIAAKRASVATRVSKQVKRKGTAVALGAAVLLVAVLLAAVLSSGSGRAKEIRSLVGQGDALSRSGDLDAALSRYDAALALAPDDARVRAKADDVRDRKRKAEAAEAQRTEAERKRREEARAKAQPEIDQGRSKIQRARTAFYQAGSDVARTDQLLQEAIAHFARAVDLLPDHAEALHLRGQAHYLRQSYAAAEKDFSAALKASSTFPAACYDRGRVYLELAVDALGQAKIRGEAADEDARAYRAKARADFDAYTRQGGGDPEQTEFAEALLASADANHARAIEICDRLIARGTTNEEVWKLKGDSHYLTGDQSRNAATRDAAYKSAAQAYGDAIAKRVNYPDAYLQRGHMLFHLGRVDEAVKDLEKAVGADRPNPAWYAARGGILHEMGRIPEALADFEKALSLRPNDPDLLRNLGSIHAQQKNYAKAVDCYDRALKAAPDHAESLAGRGAAKYGLKDYNAALADFTAALPKASRTWRLRLRIGLCYFQRKEFLKADEELSAHLALEPGSEEALYWRGRARAEQGRFQDAVADYEACLKTATTRKDDVLRLLEEARRRVGQ